MEKHSREERGRPAARLLTILRHDTKLTSNHTERDDNRWVALSDAPGLGMEVNVEAAKKYLVDTEI